MKTAAGIAGILLGIFSLTYVGIFGSMVGSAAGLLGSIPFRGNTLGPWAEMVSMLSWLAPLATIVGGIVTFSNPRVGGIILGVSAFLHWYLLGFGQVGKLFVFPIGVTAALALIASSNKSPTTSAVAAPSSQAAAGPDPSPANSPIEVRNFDRAKWNALVQYDDDVAAIAKRIQPLGDQWVDEFAASYLVLNDKQYLSSIEKKIFAAAKAAADKATEEEERRKARIEEERRAQQLEEERIAAQRREANEAMRRLYWGTPLRKFLTTGFAILVVGGIVAFFWPRHYQDAFAFCTAIVNSDCPGCEKRITYSGEDPPPAVTRALSNNAVEWRCADGRLLGCLVGASGSACRKKDRSTMPHDGIKQFCRENPNTNFVARSMLGDSAGDWVCSRGQPILRSMAQLDSRGFYPETWKVISPPISQTAQTQGAQVSASAAAAMVQKLVEAQMKGDLNGFTDAFAKIKLQPPIARGDRKTARQLNEQALGSVRNNDFQAAISTLRQARQTDPSDVEIAENLGYSLMRAGQLAEGETELTSSLNMAPDRASAWATLAQIYAKQERLDYAKFALTITYKYSRNQTKTVEFITRLAATDDDPRVRSAMTNALGLIRPQ